MTKGEKSGAYRFKCHIGVLHEVAVSPEILISAHYFPRGHILVPWARLLLNPAT